MNQREPMPTPGTIDVLPLVIEDLKERDQIGRKKYGTTLQANNGRDALIDAYQEALDQSVYLRQEIEERKGRIIMDFGYALNALREGKQVCRRGWNGKGMWIALQVPDAHSKMSLPYIYMKTADDKLVPWLASQTDILAEDWEIVG